MLLGVRKQPSWQKPTIKQGQGWKDYKGHAPFAWPVRDPLQPAAIKYSNGSLSKQRAPADARDIERP